MISKFQIIKNIFVKIWDIYKNTHRIIRISLPIIIFLLFILLIIRTNNIIQRQAYYILPFQSNTMLTNSGYDGLVITNKLLDKMQIIRFKAASEKEEDNDFQNSMINKDAVINLGTASISLNQVIEGLRIFFGKPSKQINGDVVIFDSTLYLSVRVFGVNSMTYSKNYHCDGLYSSVNNLLNDAAIHILSNTDPYTLASYYKAIDNNKMALETIEKNIHKMDEKDLKWFYFMWGSILINENSLDEGLTKLKYSITLDPHFEYPYISMADYYFKKNNFRLAEQMYFKAIEINPKNDNSYDKLAVFYRKRKNLVYSEKACNIALSLNKQNSNAIVHLGQVYKSKGDTISAIEKFKEAFYLNPTKTISLSMWAKTLKEQGKLNEAIEIYQKAFQINPFSRNIANNYALALYKGKKHKDAIKLAKHAIESDPEHKNAYAILAEIYADLDDKVNLKKYLELAYKRGWRIKQEELEKEPFSKFKNDKEFEEYLGLK